MTDAAGERAVVAPVRRRLAAAALVWEQVWPSLWPALAVLGVFLVLAAADLLPQLPGWLHALVLLLLAGALILALVRAVRSWRRPGAAQAERRLERASGLAHRPIGTLGDRLAGGSDDPAAALLWAAHQARAARAVRGVRVGLPRAGLAARDPWGLRALIMLLLAVALTDSRGDTLLRIGRALQPTLSVGGVAAAPPTVDAWITPPDYTGLPPILLGRPASGVAPGTGATGTVMVPVGSKLLAQVHGGTGAPTLTLDGGSSPFAAIDDSNYKAEATLTAGKLLSVEQDGSVLGRWPIVMVPDKPPTIAFTEAPSVAQRTSLKLAYQAADDYGLAAAKATVTLRDQPDATPLDLPLPLPHPNAKEARSSRIVDLTAHPWAGLPVVIRLTATDGVGQTGQSNAVVFTLPEREFRNPFARAIIDQRKLLSQSPRDRDMVAEILSDLSLKPARFGDDFTVFLALRTASRRLTLDPTTRSIAPVQQLLWETALRLEEGQKSSAEQELRRAQQALQDALSRNATDPEIERLMNQLQEAMNNYLQALSQQAQQQPSQPVDPSRTISGRDLQKMLDQARRLAQSGNREAAQDMLAQLQNMLENLRAAQSGQGGQGSPGQQSLRELQDMMRQQQSLLDRSFRQRQQGQSGQGQEGQGQEGQGQSGQGQDGQGQSGQGQSGMGGLARQQDALRRMLDGMRQGGKGQNGGQGQAGDGALGRAEQAMRDAAEALGRGDGDRAIAAQSDALNQLGQAARSLAESMRGQPGSQMGGAQGNPDPRAADRQDQRGRDPLGRELPGTANYDNGTVQIPEASDVQKSREILDELRRRSGDLARPPVEREYIDRLLKRF